VVIAILSILAVAVIVALNPLDQFKKANDVRRKSDLAQIQRALETYYQDNKQYPVMTNCNGASYKIQSAPPGNSCIDWGSSWPPYMNIVPQDPVPGVRYAYMPDNNNQSYYLYASLDRGSSDPQACNKGDWCASIQGSDRANSPCGANRKCNYGVSSSDQIP